MSVALASLTRFVLVIASAGTICLVSSQFMLTSLTNAIAAAPPVQHNIRQSYETHLPLVEANALNIASSVEVRTQTIATATSGTLSVASNADVLGIAVASPRVQSDRSSNRPQVLSIRGGRLVEASDRIKGWSKITSEDGGTGWVYGSLLNPIETVAAP